MLAPCREVRVRDAVGDGRGVDTTVGAVEDFDRVGNALSEPGWVCVWIVGACPEVPTFQSFVLTARVRIRHRESSAKDMNVSSQSRPETVLLA